MSWADRLDAAVEQAGSPCLLGLDPHLELLPAEYGVARDVNAPRAERARALTAFCTELLDLAAGRVAAVKPQSAFFEVFGSDGWRAWEDVVRAAHARDLLVIGDVKRGDIASTAGAYATALLEGTSGADQGALCDAVTLNPYLGTDSLEPFLRACERTGKGVFVLVRTSNPSSREFQHHGQPPLWRAVAHAVERWGKQLRGACGYSAVGAVVGTTQAAELAEFRAALPHAPLLLPGYGAQGATARDLAPAFPDPRAPWRGGLVNSSRGIAFAYREAHLEGLPWKDAARRALGEMIDDLRSALGLSAGTAGSPPRS